MQMQFNSFSKYQGLSIQNTGKGHPMSMNTNQQVNRWTGKQSKPGKHTLLANVCLYCCRCNCEQVCMVKNLVIVNERAAMLSEDCSLEQLCLYAAVCSLRFVSVMYFCYLAKSCTEH